LTIRVALWCCHRLPDERLRPEAGLLVRVLRFVLALVLAILVAAAIATVLVERGRSTHVMGEQVPPDEESYTAGIVASAIKSIDGTNPPPYRRDVHSKAHGCVRAMVEVDPQVPAAFRQGVFAQPGRQYKAWIRFSSGNSRPQPDQVKDARGMAMKLTGVEGKKLLEPEQDADTQDFVMVNSRVFFIRNIPDYAKFTRMLADGSGYRYFFDGFSLNALNWHLRDMALALQTLKPPPDSLLHTQFHTLTAYKLGPDLNIKFSARPCTSQAVAAVDRSHPNFLREEMQAELKQGDGCFELLVQPQVAGKNMPVEDPTVVWSEEDSPFVKVATVTVPKQDFDTDQQNEFCENLSFSPWHALPAHRPIGALNRVRKAVYLEDARYRRSKTMAGGGKPYLAQAEPKGWCLDLSGATCVP
jgi:catalase